MPEEAGESGEPISHNYRPCLCHRPTGAYTLPVISRHVETCSRDVAETSRRKRYTTLLMATDESGALEQLLTELSTRFTGLPVDQVDEEIERGLRLLVEFLGTDRSTLSEFSPDGKGFAHVAAWARPGLASYLTEDVQTELPWYHARVARG